MASQVNSVGRNSPDIGEVVTFGDQGSTVVSPPRPGIMMRKLDAKPSPKKSVRFREEAYVLVEEIVPPIVERSSGASPKGKQKGGILSPFKNRMHKPRPSVEFTVKLKGGEDCDPGLNSPQSTAGNNSIMQQLSKSVAEDQNRPTEGAQKLTNSGGFFSSTLKALETESASAPPASEMKSNGNPRKGCVTPEPQPLTRSNVTMHDQIWSSEPGSPTDNPKDSLSPPLKNLSEKVLQGDTNALEVMSDSDKSNSSSQDTMIMMTTEESMRNEERVAQSMEYYQNTVLKKADFSGFPLSRESDERDNGYKADPREDSAPAERDMRQGELQPDRRGHTMTVQGRNSPMVGFAENRNSATSPHDARVLYSYKGDEPDSGNVLSGAEQINYRMSGNKYMNKASPKPVNNTTESVQDKLRKLALFDDQKGSSSNAVSGLPGGQERGDGATSDPDYENIENMNPLPSKAQYSPTIETSKSTDLKGTSMTSAVPETVSSKIQEMGKRFLENDDDHFTREDQSSNVALFEGHPKMSTQDYLSVTRPQVVGNSTSQTSHSEKRHAVLYELPNNVSRNSNERDSTDSMESSHYAMRPEFQPNKNDREVQQYSTGPTDREQDLNINYGIRHGRSPHFNTQSPSIESPTSLGLTRGASPMQRRESPVSYRQSPITAPRESQSSSPLPLSTMSNRQVPPPVPEKKPSLYDQAQSGQRYSPSMSSPALSGRDGQLPTSEYGKEAQKVPEPGHDQAYPYGGYGSQTRLSQTYPDRSEDGMTKDNQIREPRQEPESSIRNSSSNPDSHLMKPRSQFKQSPFYTGQQDVEGYPDQSAGADTYGRVFKQSSVDQPVEQKRQSDTFIRGNQAIGVPQSAQVVVSPLDNVQSQSIYSGPASNPQPDQLSFQKSQADSFRDQPQPSSPSTKIPPPIPSKSHLSRPTVPPKPKAPGDLSKDFTPYDPTYDRGRTSIPPSPTTPTGKRPGEYATMAEIQEMLKRSARPPVTLKKDVQRTSPQGEMRQPSGQYSPTVPVQSPTSPSVESQRVSQPMPAQYHTNESPQRQDPQQPMMSRPYLSDSKGGTEPMPQSRYQSPTSTHNHMSPQNDQSPSGRHSDPSYQTNAQYGTQGTRQSPHYGTKPATESPSNSAHSRLFGSRYTSPPSQPFQGSPQSSTNPPEQSPPFGTRHARHSPQGQPLGSIGPGRHQEHSPLQSYGSPASSDSGSDRRRVSPRPQSTYDSMQNSKTSPMAGPGIDRSPSDVSAGLVQRRNRGQSPPDPRARPQSDFITTRSPPREEYGFMIYPSNNMPGYLANDATTEARRRIQSDSGPPGYLQGNQQVLNSPPSQLSPPRDIVSPPKEPVSSNEQSSKPSDKKKSTDSSSNSKNKKKNKNKDKDKEKELVKEEEDEKEGGMAPKRGFITYSSIRHLFRKKAGKKGSKDLDLLPNKVTPGVKRSKSDYEINRVDDDDGPLDHSFSPMGMDFRTAAKRPEFSSTPALDTSIDSVQDKSQRMAKPQFTSTAEIYRMLQSRRPASPAVRATTPTLPTSAQTQSGTYAPRTHAGSPVMPFSGKNPASPGDHYQSSPQINAYGGGYQEKPVSEQYGGQMHPAQRQQEYRYASNPMNADAQSWQSREETYSNQSDERYPPQQKRQGHPSPDQYRGPHGAPAWQDPNYTPKVLDTPHTQSPLSVQIPPNMEYMTDSSGTPKLVAKRSDGGTFIQFYVASPDGPMVGERGTPEGSSSSSLDSAPASQQENKGDLRAAPSNHQQQSYNDNIYKLPYQQKQPAINLEADKSTYSASYV